MADAPPVRSCFSARSPWPPAPERGSETATTSSSAPRFTLRQAVERAFQNNPAVLTARQEIRRTKGVQIQVRAEAIPHLDASGMFNHIAPSLRAGSESAFTLSDNSYNVSLTGSQLIYNGSVIPAIKGAAAATDASLYALRNTIDQVIATVRQQFYLVILNRALIGVQEESVNLLEAQLKDQQNRFEAGTVPRFNVLQAEVALANQQPALITARNNYRIAQLQLARTIGLDFNPKPRRPGAARMRRRTGVYAARDATDDRDRVGQRAPAFPEAAAREYSRAGASGCVPPMPVSSRT